jgi:transcriptional antiterminator RfaH
MSMAPRPPWFLAQLRPNALRLALDHLDRQGFSVFCPRQMETRRRAGRFIEVEAPLFPGYVFITFDPDTAPWRAINSTRGISRLVTFGAASPSPVPDALIQALMARCDETGALVPQAQFAAGEQVKLVGGPFADFAAKVETMAAQSRVWVLLDIMGRQTRLAVPTSQLQRA